MAIGSKVIGSSVVAGQYGIIQSQTQVADFSQLVQLVAPAQTLATIEQSVLMVDKAKTLARFTQRVLASNQDIDDIFVPYGYVELDGIILTCETPANNIRVTHNEDQSSTASMNVTYPTGIQINIPSFHGKPVRVLVHEDSGDIESELIPLFTGWVESAKHNLSTQSIDFTCSDLRAERLAREFESGKAPSWAKFSRYVSGEPESKRLWATYLESYSGNMGYTRAGELTRWDWDVTAATPTLTLTDSDVAYENLTTEFMTRSSVINEITVKGQYRWLKLNSVTTTINAYKRRNLGFDYTAFNRDNLLTKVETLPGWDLTDYRFYPLERAYGAVGITVDVIWNPYGRRKYCQGINADLVRRVAQPVTEEYKSSIRSPESIAAYGETINGGTISFAIDNSYEGSYWENDIRERASFNPANVSKAGEQAKADALRGRLSNAFKAAHAQAKRRIVASHRQNYASCVLHRIQPLEIGDVVQHDNRILNVKGQVVGLSYTIADGVRDTEIRIAFCYLDTDVTATESIGTPTKPYTGLSGFRITSTALYNSQSGVFDIVIPDISEDITDNLTLNRASSGEVVVNKVPVTLINGY